MTRSCRFAVIPFAPSRRLVVSAGFNLFPVESSCVASDSHSGNLTLATLQPCRLAGLPACLPAGKLFFLTLFTQRKQKKVEKIFNFFQKLFAEKSACRKTFFPYTIYATSNAKSRKNIKKKCKKNRRLQASILFIVLFFTQSLKK